MVGVRGREMRKCGTPEGGRRWKLRTQGYCFLPRGTLTNYFNSLSLSFLIYEVGKILLIILTIY